jgi:DNA processing protein
MTDDTNTEPTRPTAWLLTALQLHGVGVAAVRQVARQFLDVDGDEIDQTIVRQHAKLLAGNRRDEKAVYDRARRIVEECSARSIRILSIADREYPSRLREVRDAPPILYVRGSVQALSMMGCAVVGTRKSSEAGECIARRIAAVLTRMKMVTVSGLALGIDASAHAGAIASNGVTIAVLAHGLDTVAPTSNRKLADDLLAHGGALISEHEPGIRPRPAEFVRRNRIQSGISLCSIIVESGAVGGAIHQARFTKEQGRPLFAVLPDFSTCPDINFNPEGGKFLVHNMKATAIRTADDLELHLSRLLMPESGAANDARSAVQTKLQL